MPRNNKLTNVLRGRTVRAATADLGEVMIWFADQSSMKVKTAEIANISPGGTIKAIQEDFAEFTLQFEDSSAVTMQLADPGASVAVRDKNNQIEYLG